MVFYATCKAILGRGQPGANELNFFMKHAPGAGSIISIYDFCPGLLGTRYFAEAINVQKLELINNPCSMVCKWNSLKPTGILICSFVNFPFYFDFLPICCGISFTRCYCEQIEFTFLALFAFFMSFQFV